MLKLLGVSAGTAFAGTGLAAASDGPLHLQVRQPTALCDTVPNDRHLALIEDSTHERGRGFYAGTGSQTWAFTGWLKQTKPSTTAKGSITPASDASEPSHRLVSVTQPGELQAYQPTDQHFAFVEDPSHEKGRGFYTGGSNGTWYFVGWLEQNRPSKTAGGAVSPNETASQPGERLLQVKNPKRLEDHDPTDYHLAFIEDASHEKGRGFYSGGSNGTWYFVGWLAQSPPSGEASDVIDPNGSECGADSGTDSGSDDTSGDETDTTTGTGTLSNGAWCWWGDEIGPYESWLGDQLQVVATGRGKNEWQHFIDFDTRDFPEQIDGSDDRILLPHIPMVSREENDAIGRTQALRNLAAGKYNDKFRSMAEGFKADGFTTDTLVLRIGNEFNIEAQPYSPVGTSVSADTWIQGYRQIVDVCRDVLGDDLRTVWAPLVHSTQMSTDEVLAHYPGAEYAMVGADVYDSAPAYGKQSKAPQDIDYDNATESERATVQQYVWEENHCKGDKWGGDGVGLDDIAQLAADVGRPIAIPEWGLSHDGYEWGGDVNPVFVQNMFDWMNEHDVAFHAYFEHDTPQQNHALGEGDFDFATAETTYQGTFGGQSVTVDDGSSQEDTEEDTVDSVSDNYVFLTESDIQTQKQRVDDGAQPWKSAYDDLVSDANNYLNTSLRSVTDNGGGHDYTADSSRHDYKASIEMSTWARDCALAYRFTGNDAYAARAVEIIHHWCLGDGTYMEPTVEIAGQSGTIEQHITIPAFAYAASLVRGHAAWDDYDGSRPWDGGSSGSAEAAFQQWVADRADTYVESRPGYCVKNNKWAWRIVDRAVTAAYLQDDAAMEKAKQMWQAQAELCDGTPRPWGDFVNNYKDGRAYDGTANPKENGIFKLELHRSQGFAYTAYNLKAMTTALVVFERYDGTSLYGFNAPTDNKSGSSLWKAFNWFEEYVQDTSAWKWNSGGIPNSSVQKATSAFELAHAHWGDFDGVLNDPDQIGGRPHYDYRLLGHVTLTHGAE
ncbi:alginate lyase family protein [Halosimplex amylolyticum]|uniref:alginate lyase family protein n=1 Tax=Halosimplex amylolyticum TaxID=3396616 RepID=UPI003F54CBC9